MKPLHSYVQSKTWQRKVVLIALYHTYQCISDRHWTIKNTADYFHISIGLASENLKLWKNYDKVKSCLTRKYALELIK